jgi:VanZ family protein
MSTATFSDENTSSFVANILRALFPGMGFDQLTLAKTVFRKGAHLFEYFILGLLLIRAVQISTRSQWTCRSSFFVLLGVLACALGDEFHQSFLSSRTGSIRDVAIDATGGLFSQFVSALRYRYWPR